MKQNVRDNYWLEKHFRIFAFLLILISALFIFSFGRKLMYFHQDDIYYLIDSRHSPSQLLLAPVGEHIDYIFRLFFKLQWQLFGLNFVPYLVVNISLHLLNLALLFLIVSKLTKNSFFAWASMLIFSLDTNWNETVLWVSGQTYTLAIFLLLWSYYFLLTVKDNRFKFLNWLLLTLFLFLPGITSGLGVWFPLVVFMFYGINYKNKKLTWISSASLLPLLVFLFIYLTRRIGVESSNITLNLKTIFEDLIFTVFAIGNTVIGCLFIPWDSFLKIRFMFVLALLLLVLVKRKSIFNVIRRDQTIRFLLLCLFVYYLFIGIGRVQYGLGIYKAQRYSYLGLIFILLITTKLVSHFKIPKFLIALISTTIFVVQISGFYYRALPYTQRPAQVSEMITSLQHASGCYQDDYLPSFVSPIKTPKYSQLLPLINNPNLTLGKSSKCLAFPLQ